MSKSPGERMSMCAQMYEDAKEFAKVGMPEGLSSTEKEIFIFERIHGAKPADLVYFN